MAEKAHKTKLKHVGTVRGRTEVLKVVKETEKNHFGPIKRRFGAK